MRKYQANVVDQSRLVTGLCSIEVRRFLEFPLNNASDGARLGRVTTNEKFGIRLESCSNFMPPAVHFSSYLSRLLVRLDCQSRHSIPATRALCNVAYGRACCDARQRVYAIVG